MHNKTSHLMISKQQKYRINDLIEIMNAYTANNFTQDESETLNKLYCLNLTKHQKYEYKSQQKNPYTI